MILRLIRPTEKNIEGYRKSRERHHPATKEFDRELDDWSLKKWIRQLRNRYDGRIHFWLIEDDGSYVGRFSFSEELLDTLKRDLLWSIDRPYRNPRVLERAMIYMGLEKIADAFLKKHSRYGKGQKGDKEELDEIR